MNYKTKKAAINALGKYSRFGVVFQYVSGRWNWATMGSPIDGDLKDGGQILNPSAPSIYHVPVTNVEYVA